MTEKCVIPEEFTVGFQKRKDTYSEMLGFIVHKKTKSEDLSKRASWENWRDKTIEPIEHKNEPTTGFVINKDVGGVRRSYGWDARIEKVRVYDPRGFEIEITLPNLLYILSESVCNKGKGLEGEFVYGWSGRNLILIPAGSDLYKNSTDFTSIKKLSQIKAKNLKVGATYMTKNLHQVIYLGVFTFYGISNSYRSISYNQGFTSIEQKAFEKSHVFYIKEGNKWVFSQKINIDPVTHYKKSKFGFMKDVKNIMVEIDSTCVSNYAELVEEFLSSRYGSKIVSYELRSVATEKDLADRLSEFMSIKKQGVLSSGMCYEQEGVLHQIAFTTQQKWRGTGYVYNTFSYPQVKVRRRANGLGLLLEYSSLSSSGYNLVDDVEHYRNTEEKEIVFLDESGREIDFTASNEYQHAESFLLKKI